MMWRSSGVALLGAALCGGAIAGDVLSTSGFTNCNTGSSTMNVQKVDISFDKSTSQVTFDVAGSNTQEQNVTAEIKVEAYGVQVYSNSFNPCDDSTKVTQLCPVPAGNFSAKGNQTIPAEYLSKIPSIAFSVPDIDATAQLVLKATDGSQVACIDSTVTNGKTVEIPAVSYVAAGIAAASLAASLASAGLSGFHGGSGSSPGFTEMVWWFQGLAMNGMHSVNYPAVYRSFSKNFAFSTGLVPWGAMQTSIDNFRKATGGNLTEDNYQYLKNATLQFPDGSTVQTSSGIAKRAFLFARDGISTTVNSTSSGSSSNSTSKQNQLVSGIQGYVEQVTVPQANAFMTILLVFAIIIGAIVIGILLFKVIVEAWAIFGTFPKSLKTFRKEYWRVMAQTIVSLVMLLYGIWTLYCIFQFTHGDSWAAQVLAGVTLGAFTAVLAFYTWKIWFVARKFKQMQGDASGLYEDKPTWKKYRIFYENYKKQYWWLFVPFIVYSFAKGCVLGAADGHGLVQTAGQLVIEALMLALLLWNRPFDRKSGNWINVFIQVVRVLSVVCILVFVEELGISKTTTTITGVVLIVVQSSLTVILGLLIVINAIISCCRENPHRKRRKAALKQQNGDTEGDAFLMQSGLKHRKSFSDSSMDYDHMRGGVVARPSPLREDSSAHLVSNAATMGQAVGKNGYSPLGHNKGTFEVGLPARRQATLPDVRFENVRTS